MLNFLAFLMAASWIPVTAHAAMTGDFKPVILWLCALGLFLWLRGRSRPRSP